MKCVVFNTENFDRIPHEVIIRFLFALLIKKKKPKTHKTGIAKNELWILFNNINELVNINARTLVSGPL